MRSLSRKLGSRTSLEKNLLTSLVMHGRILTTEAKAKHIKPLAEQLLTRAKADTLPARRHAATLLTTNAAVAHLFSTVVPQLPVKDSGFVHIIKTTPRSGDSAPRAVVRIATKPVQTPAPTTKKATATKAAATSKTAKK